MTTTSDSVRDVLLAAAIAAPSMHNTQPWRCAVDGGRVRVAADPARWLRHEDPAGRAQHLSCGAAVFNLRAAAEHLRYRPRVRLLPACDDPAVLADVDLGLPHPEPGPLAELYDAIPRRRTNRRPFTGQPVPAALLRELTAAAAAEGAALQVHTEPSEVERIVDLMRDAEIEEGRTGERAQERAQWIGTDRTDDGIPSYAQGPRPERGRTPFRDLADRYDPRRETARFEDAPVLAMLSTASDRPLDWLRAGQALQRALLVATSGGLSASFLNQPLEHDTLRWLVRSPLTGTGYPHMLLRLGYGPPAPATPRRPVEEVTAPPVATDPRRRP